MHVSGSTARMGCGCGVRQRCPTGCSRALVPSCTEGPVLTEEPSGVHNDSLPAHGSYFSPFLLLSGYEQGTQPTTRAKGCPVSPAVQTAIYHLSFIHYHLSFIIRLTGQVVSAECKKFCNAEL